MAEKWREVINVSKISDRMILIKAMAQCVVVSVISAYAPKWRNKAIGRLNQDDEFKFFVQNRGKAQQKSVQA